MKGLFSLPSGHQMFWGVLIVAVVMIAVLRFGLLSKTLTGKAQDAKGNFLPNT